MQPVQFGMQSPVPSFRGVAIYDPDTGEWTDEGPRDTGDRWTPGDSELGERPSERHEGDDFYRQPHPDLQIVPVTETPQKKGPTPDEIAIINSILENGIPELPGIGPQKDDKPTVH